MTALLAVAIWGAIALVVAVGILAYRFGSGEGWRDGYRYGTGLSAAGVSEARDAISSRTLQYKELLRRAEDQADRAARVTHGALYRAREAERQAKAELQRYLTGVQCELVFDLPEPFAGEGYLYVIEFSTGVVKVGQTIDPRRRLPEHRRDADTFKVAIVDFWISPAHWNYLDNEIDLINRCMQVSTRARREYFRDVNFSEAVAYAAELTYCTQEEVSDEHVKH